MEFSPSPPYDFARTVAAARFLFVLGRSHGNAYRRVLRMGEALALVEISSAGTVDAPLLRAEVLASTGAVSEAALRAKLAQVLNLGSDLTPFYAAAAHDSALARTVEGLYGLHSLQADSVLEALFLTIIEQQIALKMAQTAQRWLLEWGGARIDYAGETYYAFPSAAKFAAATVPDLTPLKITFGRMQRMIDLAQMAHSGQLDLEALRQQPTDTAYRQLVALPGVGHWTAAWTLFRAQGRAAYVGASDVALRAAVNAYYYGASGRADVGQVEQIFAQYGAFAGLAAYYTMMRWAFERF